VDASELDRSNASVLYNMQFYATSSRQLLRLKFQLHPVQNLLETKLPRGWKTIEMVSEVGKLLDIYSANHMLAI